MTQVNPFEVLSEVWLVVISSTPSGFLRLILMGVIIYYFVWKQRRHRALTFKLSNGAFQVLDKKKIIYLQSEGNYLNIHTLDRTYRTRMTIKSFLSMEQHDFLRIHKSTIINWYHVRKLQHWRNGEYLITMSNGKSLTSSISYRQTINLIKNGLMNEEPTKIDPFKNIVRPTAG